MFDVECSMLPFISGLSFFHSALSTRHCHPRRIPMSPRLPLASRAGRTYWAILIYLVVFALLLLGVMRFYLFPAIQAAQTASPEDRRRLAAVALLVMIVVLFVLGAGLVLTFRIGRFFLPRPGVPRKRTEYVD